MKISQIHLSVNKGGAFSALNYISGGLQKLGHSIFTINKKPIEKLREFQYDAVILHSFNADEYENYSDCVDFL